jgi:hypothetical protein
MLYLALASVFDFLMKYNLGLAGHKFGKDFPVV